MLTTLTLPALVTLAELITACSIGGSSTTHEALARVIQTTSQGQTTYIYDATSGAAYTPESLPRALATARGLTRSGHAVYVGLAALNASWVLEQGYSLEHAFTPCTHIALASEHLDAVLLKHKPSSTNDWHLAFASYLEPTSDSRRKTLGVIELSAAITLSPAPELHTSRSSFEPRGNYTLGQGLFFQGGAPALEQKPPSEQARVNERAGDKEGGEQTGNAEDERADEPAEKSASSEPRGGRP